MDANNFSLLGMWSTMNWVAKGVVIVLLAMSIWSLTIAVERLWRFQKAKHESLDVAVARDSVIARMDRLSTRDPDETATASSGSLEFGRR